MYVQFIIMYSTIIHVHVCIPVHSSSLSLPPPSLSLLSPPPPPPPQAANGFMVIIECSWARVLFVSDTLRCVGAAVGVGVCVRERACVCVCVFERERERECVWLCLLFSIVMC